MPPIPPVWLTDLIHGLVTNWIAASFGPDSVMGWIVALVLIVWFLASWHRRQVVAKKHGMASWYFIIPCFVVAIIAIAASAFGLGLQLSAKSGSDTGTAAPNPPPTKKSEYVTNQEIGSAFSGNESPQPAIQYQGTFARNVNWLRVYVDIQEGGPAKYRRLKITELKDHARGQHFVIPVAIREDGPDKNWIFRWGDSNERFRVEGGGFYFSARIALIGEANDEQYYYFMVIPDQINGRSYLMVLNETRLNFRQEWEQFDARK